jgi:hypothetical protein
MAVIEDRRRAIEVAREHVEAYTNHDYDTARSLLADDVSFTVITSEPGIPNPAGVGVDQFMDEITQFAQTVEPGSAKVLASAGDERRALLMVSVRAALIPGRPPVSVLAARHYVVNDERKIQTEQVIFFPLSG